jgi:hypothetical protein
MDTSVTPDTWRLLTESRKTLGFDDLVTAHFWAHWRERLEDIHHGLGAWLNAHPVEVFPMMRIPKLLTLTEPFADGVLGVYHHNKGIRPVMLLDVVAGKARLEEIVIHEVAHHVDFSGDRRPMLNAHAKIWRARKIPEAWPKDATEYFAVAATEYVTGARIDDCHKDIVRTAFENAGLPQQKEAIP